MAVAVLSEVEPFDLATVVRDYLATTTEPDPHVIAEMLARTLSDDEKIVAFYVMFPAYVRTLVGHERNGKAGRPATQVSAPVSPRWMAVDAFRRRHFVKDGWKLYGDFTREDVLTLVDAYRKSAADDMAHAKRHKKIADLMTERSALRVRQLPAAQVERILGGE